ncbi:MAG: glycoside hydrolase family 2 protein [Actinomycetes bacterium]
MTSARTRAIRTPDLVLDGTWRAAASDGDLAREFAGPAFDDDDWNEVTVPGHWRAHAALRDVDGPVLHRRAFDTPPIHPGRRRFLTLDGVFTLADVWLDGAYLGPTEGYFTPHTFEIGRDDPTRREHLLAIEVACPHEADRTAKRSVSGVFAHWDAMDPGLAPGGIWQPVRVRDTGPVRIARLRTICTEAGPERGRLLLDLSLDARGEEGRTPIVLHAAVTGPDGTLLTLAEREVTLADGDNHLAWAVDVDAPPRWWPWRLGPADLCGLTVTVEVGGTVSDERTLHTAFREVRVRDWRWTVNGEDLFVMGTNLAPTRALPATATAAELAQDIALAREANLDLVRVHAHVARPELYDAADAAGMLVWQDLPLQWGYARSVRRSAVHQARDMVDLLGHHPSIALWCAHNEPLAVVTDTDVEPTPGTLARLGAAMVLPTWNKDVLDRSIARALRRADPSRPVNPHSGVLPGLTSPGTDSHFYFGWYHGALDGLAPALRAAPRLGRFVSEFGAQSVPNAATFLHPERWPDLDWEHLAEHHSLQRAILDRHVPMGAFTTFDEWRDATQAYQAALITLQVEDLRRLRFDPTGGFCQFSFADPNPAISWSVLDHERVPKLGYGALRDSCRSLLPMIEPRQGLVHVVNETAERLPDARVIARIDDREHVFVGDVTPHGLTFVGRVGPVVGAERAEVVLEHDGRRIEHRYDLLLPWLGIGER